MLTLSANSSANWHLQNKL